MEDRNVKRIVHDYDMMSLYMEVGEEIGQYPMEMLHEDGQVSGLVPIDLWGRYQEALQRVRDLHKEIAVHYERRDPLTELEARRAKELWEKHEEESARYWAELQEKCDHKDSYGSLLNGSGGCILCGANPSDSTESVARQLADIVTGITKGA